MVASDTSFVVNNTNSQLTADYTIPYPQYNASSNGPTTSNPLYPYNLPPQQDNNERYWGNNAVNNNNTKRQSKR